jgi:hypothetical protein
MDITSNEFGKLSMAEPDSPQSLATQVDLAENSWAYRRAQHTRRFGLGLLLAGLTKNANAW